MKKIEITLYNFNELSNDAQQNALDKMRDINVSFDWWDFTYDDAKTIGLIITGFDLDRRRGANGYFVEGAKEAADLILENHGESCETYKTAKSFLADYDALVAKFATPEKPNQVSEENEYEFDQEADELEQEFLKSLLEDYSIILQNEYEYLCSDESITETINSNEYTFEEDGTLNNG